MVLASTRAQADDSEIGLIIEHSYLSAKQKAEEQNKPYIIQFTASWCMPCDWLDETTLKETEIVEKLNKDYVFVLVDIEEFEGYSLKKYYQINNLPTLLVFSPTHQLLDRIDGSPGKHRLKELLDSDFTKKSQDQNSGQVDESIVNRSPSEGKDGLDSQQIRESNIRSEIPEAFGGEVFAIQIGVYGSVENARKKESEIRKKLSTETLITSAEIEKNSVYKVYLGPFESEYEAQALLDKLKKKKIEGLVKKISLSEKI